MARDTELPSSENSIFLYIIIIYYYFKGILPKKVFSQSIWDYFYDKKEKKITNEL